MARKDRSSASRRVFATTVLGAALATGVLATAMPATAAQPAQPTHAFPASLSKLGARAAPFSAKSAASATTAKGLTPANAADHPWLVGIVLEDSLGTNNTCTGTIISPTKVLTSAGCDWASAPRVRT